jgi:glutamyl-Q tRNA(Asp) synthetase
VAATDPRATTPLHGPAGAPRYVGRFAPSPTGPLHAGSLVAALASWLDARAHGGRWLLRIEDVDTPRCVPGMDRFIAGQLAACGMHPDEPPWRQSTRGDAYAAALQQLADAGLTYRCDCTRREIDAALAARGIVHERFAERVYPGTCRPRRDASGGPRGRPAFAWRFACPTGESTPTAAPTPPAPPTGPAISNATGSTAHDLDRDVASRHPARVHWIDRCLGPQVQDVAAAVGDFVLRRADGVWAYQLAVVVDDAAQGVTDIVRGADLADNTARQILLQRALGLPTPRTLHTPLVLGTDGHKLSKQNGAAPLELAHPVAALQAAAAVLGMPTLDAPDPATWLMRALPAWAGMIADFSPPEPPPEPR